MSTNFFPCVTLKPKKLNDHSECLINGEEKLNWCSEVWPHEGWAFTFPFLNQEV